MQKTLLVILLLTLILHSCYKDDIEEVNVTILEYPDIIIETTNLAGKIIYSDGTIPEIEKLKFKGEEYDVYESYFNFKGNQLNRNFIRKWIYFKLSAEQC